MPKTAVRKASRTRKPAKADASALEPDTKRPGSRKKVIGKLEGQPKKGSPALAAGSKRAPKAMAKKAEGRTAGESAARVPVNEIVEQWQRERPDIDPAPMRLFGVLAQAHLLTTPYINRVIAKHGLVRGTFDVLSALRRAGPPFSLTPKQLAESLMLSGAGMTSRLDRLETLHLVARLPEPNDRRSLKIQLTQKGVKLIDEIIPQIVDAQWQLVASLGSDDTATLIDLLRRLTEALFASIDPGDLG